MIDSFLKYIEFEKRFSTHTIIAYQTDLGQFEDFLSSTFPDYKIETADFGVIRSWIVELVELEMDSLSINRKIACLRSYFKYLMRQQKIESDPMLKIKILKTRRKLPQFVKEPDMVKLLDNGQFEDSFEGWRDRLIMELFYGTGIRLSELIGLKESQLNISDRTIKVLGKRNKERVIPFGESLVSIMETYRSARNREVNVKDHGHLFVTESGDMCYPMMIYRVVNKYLTIFSSNEKKSPHVLRHSYATHLLDKGAEINAIKDLLGHSSLAATQVYTHNSMEKMKKIFDQAHPKA